MPKRLQRQLDAERSERLDKEDGEEPPLREDKDDVAEGLEG